MYVNKNWIDIAKLSEKNCLPRLLSSSSSNKRVNDTTILPKCQRYKKRNINQRREIAPSQVTKLSDLYLVYLRWEAATIGFVWCISYWLNASTYSAIKVTNCKCFVIVDFWDLVDKASEITIFNKLTKQNTNLTKIDETWLSNTCNNIFFLLLLF